MELYRRQNESDPLEVASFHIDQLEGPGRLHGYKLHQLNCIQVGYAVTQIIMIEVYKLHVLTRYVSCYNRSFTL